MAALDADTPLVAPVAVLPSAFPDAVLGDVAPCPDAVACDGREEHHSCVVAHVASVPVADDPDVGQDSVLEDGEPCDDLHKTH